MHDGLWVLEQIAQADKEAFIKIRARGKSNHVPIAPLIRCGSLHEEWQRWLYAALSASNERGSIIEFGANPRTVREKNGHISPCLPTAIVVNFRVGKGYTLQERLQQVSFLSVAQFEPSILVQHRERLYGIYLLDAPIDETTRYNLAIRISKLVHSSQWRKVAKPDCLLPLPGFLERNGQKQALLYWPPSVSAAKLYTITEFENFPDAAKENHAEFYRRAGADPEDAKRFLAGLLEEAKRLGDRRGVLAGAMIERDEAKKVRMRRKLGIFQEPTRNAVPPIEALTVLKFHGMTMTYVRQGTGIRRETLRKLVRSLLRLDLDVNISTKDAFAALDGAIISQLVELGYTPQAVLEFYWRPGHLCGQGKSITYLLVIYNKEIERLRAVCPPPKEPPKNTPLLDCVVTFCRMVPELSKEERDQYARLRGDTLFIHPKKAYRLYRAAMIAQNVTPCASSEITNEINHLEAPYWLGCRIIDGHKMWCLSMKYLQSLGLFPDTSILKVV